MAPGKCRELMLIKLFSTGYIGILSIYGYFIVGSLFNKILMAPIIKLVFQQEKLEGNFR